jgi:RHS repeat-associated protein
VTHEFSDIVAGGDFYPYGLEIVDRQIKRESYRYGYQGKYSELDQETNWNHFELREYDAVIGRTTTPDPAMQFHSSYMWVGNNPIIGTDPTGGLSPIYGKNGKFLGVDSEGFKGKVITMDEGLFNQLTDNGANILDHDFTMSLANNGIFANFLSDGLLSAKAYSRVLTDIVSKTEGITNFGEIKGGGIDIYSWTDPSKRLGLTDLKPTRYQADQNSKSVSMNYAYRNEMNTVESIQSYLGVHEWQGHVIRGYHHGTGIHDKTYGLQRTHSTFPRLRMTNPGLYEEVNQRYSNPASKWK